MKKYFLTLNLCAIFCCAVLAQAPSIGQKQMQAHRIVNQIKIDGNLSEAEWLTAKNADNFIQNTPDPGQAPTEKTVVKILYDNTALYIGAILYDSNPDSILNQLTERDELGNTDWFGVALDTYQDGNNGVGFVTTPSGIQFDTKYSALSGGNGGFLNGDENWDAVWNVEARITEEGWEVEMMIPYSAIRFPEAENQIWNINFGRQVRRKRELMFWNEINPAIDGLLNQSGQISGISDIKSPVRLSATPFVAVYAENNYDQNGDPKSSWGRSFQGGMDVKYGLNDAFTLDMTLIPDFGQVQFDNQVLNLSPFEVRFDENRQFFTEGTELFNKGGLFYSRRVGGTPLHRNKVQDQVQIGEEIIENPSESQLINASKVSGRTNTGLGVGIFNALSSQTEATLRNIETNEKRTIQTSPLTNYNVLAFDQNLKNNSYISLVNTNVFRSGEDYEANSTAAVFSLRNKANSYQISGRTALSQKYFTDDTDLGHTADISVAKTSGNFQWSLSYLEESDTYDINDLGFLFNNNERSLDGSINLNRFKQLGIFNRIGAGLWSGLNWLYNPQEFTSYGINMWVWGRTRNFFAFGVRSYFEPIRGYDYFEPRTEDFSYYYRGPKVARFAGWISSDYRKKFALDLEATILLTDEAGRYNTIFEVGPRYRFNDKWSLNWEVEAQNSHKQEGWVYTNENNGEIIFGVRDNISVTNVLNTTYTFNNKMSFSLRLRHYWSKAEYKSFGLLDHDGELGNTDYNEFNDRSFNSLNVDAVYRWRFAPGSDIFIVWKNNTSQFDNESGQVSYNYGNSVSRLFGDIPTTNSLSIKVLYFLDYLSLKRK